MTTVPEISNRFVDDVTRLDPTRAARSMGTARDAPVLTDFSPAATDAMSELYRRTIADLAAAQPVDRFEELGAAFLHEHAAGHLAVIDAGEPSRMMSTLTGPQAAARMSFDLMSRSDDAGWERVAARLESVPASMESYRASLADGLAASRLAPSRLVRAVADQCATWAGTTGRPGWFATFVAAYGDGALHDRLDGAAGGAARGYAELSDWLRDTYLPAAEVSSHEGVGAELYKVWARSQLGVADLDLDEAYAWGADELARLEAEKAVECNRIVPGASFDEVRHVLMTDPARSVEGVDAYRSWLQDITDEALEGLQGREFDIPVPLRRCEVGIPAEGGSAAAYYTPPSEDLSTPGRAWYPTVGKEVFPMWDQVTIAYHEAVPGHHLQLGVTRMLPLTRAHRLGFNPAHGEGWALYSERLMDELGWFRTPDTRLGFLCGQAFRAARVMVDIGLHTRRRVPQGWPDAGEPWTYERAVAFIVRAGGMSQAFAESEVLRYLSWPSQATAYKLGERAWTAARHDAQAAAGSSFDRKAWHSRALALGALGLDRLAVELRAA